MRKVIGTMLATTLAFSSAHSAYAAGYFDETENVLHEYGAFMGAYLRIPFGRQHDDPPRAGLQLALVHDSKPQDGSSFRQRQYFNTLEFGFSDLSSAEGLSAPKLLVAGRSIQEYEQKLALSGENALYIVGGAVLAVGALVLVASNSNTTGDDWDWCFEEDGEC